MESTIHNRTTDRAGFFTFFWSVLLTTALSALVMWLCGGYAGYAFTHPGYLMPAAAVYVLDIAARLVFGLSLFFTLYASEREGANETAKTACVTLWAIAYAMSILLIPALFALKWQMFSFIWMLAMIGVTTTQFIVSFKVSIAAALSVLPYWALLIYGACVLFAIM